MKIERKDLEATISGMKSQGYTYLIKITAVDYEKFLTVLYMIRNMQVNKDEIIELEIDPADAWVPTIINLHKSADWYERELSEMFGIVIKNRKAGRLLLEKWNGKPAPLRKNFVWNAPYETSD